MTDRKSFPVFACHQLARCFHCGSVLVGHRLDGFASQCGQYNANCAGGCGHRTWYDLCEREEAS
jgi:hypothetical protein